LNKQLGLENRGEIQLNVLFRDKDGNIVVTARSGPGECPLIHPWNGAVMACQAMEQNKPVVQTHVRKIQGFEDKPYDCVAAVPIAHKKMALGAITVDSKGSQTLDGHEDLLDRILRPYAAILLLTRPKDAPYHPCPQRTVR
jgi:hypothetical protein